MQHRGPRQAGVQPGRGPAQVARPDESLIARPASRDLPFGAGPHRCLGSHLARLELEVAVQLSHERIPEYRIDPDGLSDEHTGGVVGASGWLPGALTTAALGPP